MKRLAIGIFAAFSIVWVLLILALLGFKWMADNYMMSSEISFLRAATENGIIIAVALIIWFGAYRLTRWIDERK